MIEDATLLQRLLDPLPAAVWAVAGWVFAQFWRRYRVRTVVLTWQAHHQALAVSTQDARFGTIQVLYNGNEVQNLFFTRIAVQNQTNIDLTALDLNVVFNDGTTIFIAHGGVEGSVNALPFAEPFAGEADRFMKLPDDAPNRPSIAAGLLRRRDFRVPVLNRGGSVTIGMLVQAPPGQQPFVHLASDTQGIRLRFQVPQHLIFGVERRLAAPTGLLLGLLITAGLIVSRMPASATGFAAFAVGCVTAVLGASAVRGVRWLLRALD